MTGKSIRRSTTPVTQLREELIGHVRQRHDSRPTSYWLPRDAAAKLGRLVLNTRIPNSTLVGELQLSSSSSAMEEQGFTIRWAVFATRCCWRTAKPPPTIPSGGSTPGLGGGAQACPKSWLDPQI